MIFPSTDSVRVCERGHALLFESAAALVCVSHSSLASKKRSNRLPLVMTTIISALPPFEKRQYQQ